MIKINYEETKQIIRCLEFDIVDLEQLINTKKQDLSTVIGFSELNKEESIRIGNSIKQDLKARLGTTSFENDEAKIMINFLEKIRGEK